MEYYWLTARSVTHAQRMQNALRTCQFRVQMRRTPPEMAERGCGYMLRVDADTMHAVRLCLKNNSMAPVKVFRMQDGSYTEVNYDLF